MPLRRARPRPNESPARNSRAADHLWPGFWLCCSAPATGRIQDARQGRETGMSVEANDAVGTNIVVGQKKLFFGLDDGEWVQVASGPNGEGAGDFPEVVA